MKNKYLVKMAGIGESYIVLVDKDIWDWLDYQTKHPCPDRLADSMWSFLNEEHDSKKDMIEWYRTVPPDERATYVNEIDPSFNTIIEVMKFVKKNNINIVSECEFAIY